MFLLSRPSAQDIDRFLRASGELPLSYSPVGQARSAQRGFRLDEESAVVGSGRAAYERAKEALAGWQHFALGWIEVFPTAARITPGTDLAVLVHHLGFWSLNGCRVVYSIDNADGTQFGFAYGTLTNHAESGEVLFQVTFAPDNGHVTYTIRAASKANAALAVLGYPVVRSLQRRFRRDSVRAVARAIAG
jgi:uncharacterized protein (UPF0548 family)